MHMWRIDGGKKKKVDFSKKIQRNYLTKNIFLNIIGVMFFNRKEKIEGGGLRYEDDISAKKETEV